MTPIALSMGDPAGIGPEITVKLIADLATQRSAPQYPVVVFGDASLLRRNISSLELPLQVETVTNASEMGNDPRVVHVVAGPTLPDDLPIGEVSAHAGDAAFRYVEMAIHAAIRGDVSGIVTAPINKEAMRLAGHPYPGHTEILADLSGTSDFSMMMASDDLRVVLVTIHEPLRKAIDLITHDAVLRVIRLADRTLRRDGREPRIGVAGLNPHAGENGLMGREELDIIAPAIAEAQRLGIRAEGPFPPDTVFMRARNREFDVVVAQYHDQGLIPFKYLGLDKGANVTLGLPFVRTSVDHGTAFEIAGRGIADHSSLRVAFDQAIDLVSAR
ncbi:4-hydroxythreonine-4-phosphate dehydrogenase PdxA [Microbacterium sp. NPDC091662]|uniref:4-hydroxythreonine-4-phosphate dehydrogenase PdxA n=1 Tax=Microbacterium sp. NPDC091662 TaxID=3364211 RepID=UPI0037F52721